MTNGGFVVALVGCRRFQHFWKAQHRAGAAVQIPNEAISHCVKDAKLMFSVYDKHLDAIYERREADKSDDHVATRSAEP